MPPIPPTSQDPGGAQRILEAAGRLFAARGFDAVAVTEIAGEAGVSKANVFHHFGSKRELYVAALRAACEQTTELLGPGEGRDGAVQARLERFLAGHLEHVHERAGLTRLVVRELLEPGHNGAQELAEKAFGDGFERLVALIREGQAAGELRSGADPAAAALLMVGANIFFFQSRALLRHLPEVDFADDPAAYTRAVTDLLFRGLADGAASGCDGTGDG